MGKSVRGPSEGEINCGAMRKTTCVHIMSVSFSWSPAAAEDSSRGICGDKNVSSYPKLQCAAGNKRHKLTALAPDPLGADILEAKSAREGEKMSMLMTLAWYC
jgi:hypothetical protein